MRRLKRYVLVNSTTGAYFSEQNRLMNLAKVSIWQKMKRCTFSNHQEMEAIRHRSILSMKSFPAVKNEKKTNSFLHLMSSK